MKLQLSAALTKILEAKLKIVINNLVLDLLHRSCFTKFKQIIHLNAKKTASVITVIIFLRTV